MASKINWHRYGTKLRHCHPMYLACPAAARRVICFAAVSYLFIYLFISVFNDFCQTDYLKITDPIFVEFSGLVELSL